MQAFWAVGGEFIVTDKDGDGRRESLKGGGG